MTAPWLDDYRRLLEDVACGDLGPRGQFTMRGTDAVRVLHGLCTNDIKALVPGGGCEAFLCTVQGKIQGHVFVYLDADGLELDCVAGDAPRLIALLDRYVIREDVRFEDVSADRSQWLLAGPRAPAVLASDGLVIPPEQLAWSDGQIEGAPVRARRIAWTRGESFQVTMPRDAAPRVLETWAGRGALPVAQGALEAARIEAGMPQYGLDIDADNLPHEVGRNELAVSFHKGCYLGQEPVARLDSMGHANWHLRALSFAAAIPLELAELAAGEPAKTIAKLRSRTESPRWGGQLVLAYVRRGRDEPGTILKTEHGDAMVRLPGA